MTRKVLRAVFTLALVAGWATFAAGAETQVQPAKRYHVEQIRSGDVVLQDRQIQDFLQSELFHRMVTAKAFRRDAWTRDLLRAAFGDADLERVRHEISDYPPPGLTKAELQRVQLELDGIPWPCGTCRG